MVTLLFEHKSYPEKYPHLQLLRYMNNVWHEEQKQNKDLSVIISTVIYHGTTAWKKKSMIAYFGNPHGSLHQFIPQFDYLLFSLNEIEDFQIDNFKNDLLSMTAMLMKHSRDAADNFQSLQPFLVKSTMLWMPTIRTILSKPLSDTLKTVSTGHRRNYLLYLHRFQRM